MNGQLEHVRTAAPTAMPAASAAQTAIEVELAMQRIHGTRQSLADAAPEVQDGMIYERLLLPYLGRVYRAEQRAEAAETTLAAAEEAAREQMQANEALEDMLGVALRHLRAYVAGLGNGQEARAWLAQMDKAGWDDGAS